MLLFDTEFRRKDGTDDFACNILKYRGDQDTSCGNHSEALLSTLYIPVRLVQTLSRGADAPNQ